MKGPSIIVKGARAHNLKDVDIELPKKQINCYDRVIWVR